MREKITTRISEELKFILMKFFDEHDVDMFVQNIMDDILILTSINSFDRGGESNSFESGSFFTSRIRSIADRIMTFARENLDDNKYYVFLVEFGKMMTTEGEYFLASEIFSNILKYSTDKDNFSNIKAQAEVNLGSIYVRQAVWENAVIHLTKAQEIFERIKDNKGLSHCEHLFGVINSKKGNVDAAKENFLKGLSYLTDENEPLLTGNLELNLGNIESMRGNYDKAIEYYQSCLQKFQEINDKRRIAEVRNNLGMVYSFQKEYEYALFEYDECVKIASEGRYLPILGTAYVNKASAYIEINELKLSAFYANKGMDVCYQVNNVLAIADIYKLKGMIAKKQFEFQLAEEFLKASLRLNTELHNELNFAESAFELGLVYHELKIKESYDLYFKKALDYYQKIGAKEKVLEISGYLN